MQPLHNTSPKNGKSVLKRMSRVRSDDKEEAVDEKSELHDKTPSPIGAGLPLLQRLRLLKEKQVCKRFPMYVCNIFGFLIFATPFSCWYRTLIIVSMYVSRHHLTRFLKSP